MPYRLDLRDAGGEAIERLIDLGALDVELHERGVAALMPDRVTPEEVASALGVDDIVVSPAVGRDEESIWVLSPRAVRVGRLRIVPAHLGAGPGDLRLIDAPVFGTGLHPTTALCLEALDALIRDAVPDAVLDVGTGSGVLAIAALMLGVPRALGIDIDGESLRVAAQNASLNGVDARLQLAGGGPETVAGTWPLVLANVLAAPLIEMAPALVRRLGHRAHLVLSGIPASLEPEVGRAYRRLGMRSVWTSSRADWVVLVLQASW